MRALSSALPLRLILDVILYISKKHSGTHRVLLMYPIRVVHEPFFGFPSCKHFVSAKNKAGIHSVSQTPTNDFTCAQLQDTS